MKKLFLILSMLLLPQLAEAQTSRNPCYTTQPTAAGQSNCIGVGTATPLPVVTSGAGGSVSTLTQNDGQTNATVSEAASAFMYVYNGATWDRARSPSSATDGNNGTGIQSVGANVFNGSTYDREFACTNSAVINVTAAATTELIPLTSGQTIRVCSFVASGSAIATIATFVYGTGANCATGQTALTGAMRLSVDGNISISGGRNSLFRTAAANALCLTAVTGNVTGFVTYAKF